ncbi:hypothetical protein lerEdw1_018649, partial [Lerista edwardsae]
DFAKLTVIMAKMVRRKCAFCPEDEECAIMYVAEGQNLAVHQDCLVRFAVAFYLSQSLVGKSEESKSSFRKILYSSGFVESEENNPENLDIRFDVASVVSEIKRGKRLVRQLFLICL